jgi:hypothetical protein
MITKIRLAAYLGMIQIDAGYRRKLHIIDKEIIDGRILWQYLISYTWQRKQD